MLNRFQSFILENSLCFANQKILLAVSGGIDSVVMLDLFVKSGFTCGVAHCNFKLRGNDSDDDMFFVKNLSEKYNLPFYTASFNTEEYAEINRVSIQMAARMLRYEWFEEIRTEKEYDFIATAHNKNDAVETFLINLSRGTGIRGLSGIPIVSGQIIRPMLFLEREEIEEYARLESIPWREDSSNAQTKYARNKIRHSVIPSLKELNPNIIKTMAENISRLKDVEDIYLHALENTRKDLVIKDGKFTWISIKGLKMLDPVNTWAFELLKDFDFTAHVTSDIVKNLDAEPGKQFLSPTHRLVKDRNRLIIHPIKEMDMKRFYIEDPSMDIYDPVNINLSIIPGKSFYEIPRDTSIAWLNLDLLEFPLMIRKWEAGDYFMPLGMKNMKKISDFFVDRKISIPEKENIWLLVSGDKIAWVIGQRIDERFKITPHTERILQCRLT